MNIAKRIIALALCIVFCAVFSITAFAAETTPRITLSDISAMPNDTIKIDISIQNNPGIMALAFSVAYEKDAFEYVNYEDGWLTGMTVKNHPDKGYAIFVYVATSNKTNNGKMMSVSFKIKDSASAGGHKIVLGNNNYDKYFDSLHNSFSNSQGEYIVPIVSGGTVTVGETCQNSGHKWGDWAVTKPANCTETGIKTHTCTRCSTPEDEEIPITHDFEAEWTVDESATPEKDGVMSRHCKYCDEVTDKIIYTYEEVVGPEEPSDDPSDTSSDTPSDSDEETDTTTPSNPDSGNNNTPSEPGTSSDSSESTTSESESGNNQNAQKPTINNNVGDKNPQSSVEHLKDYQENIKPFLPPEETDDENNTDDTSANTGVTNDQNSNSSPNSETSSTSSESVKASSDDKKVFSTLTTPLGIVLITVGTAVGCSLIALVVTLLIIAHKKKKSNQNEISTEANSESDSE